MELKIGQQRHSFIPIQTFRAEWGLPESFSVAYFEPKDWPVGSLERGGMALARLKQRLLQAIPEQLLFSELMTTIEQVTDVFAAELETANVQVRLRPVEVDFAVSGFRDILQAAAYRLIRLAYARREAAILDFDFLAVYQDWLDDTVRVSPVSHPYEQEQRQFAVRLIYNAYGRVGLIVTSAGQTYYVLDMALACPAASFMRDLCAETMQAICRALATAG